MCPTVLNGEEIVVVTRYYLCFFVLFPSSFALPCAWVLRCITGDALGGCGSTGGSRISRYLDTISTEMK